MARAGVSRTDLKMSWVLLIAEMSEPLEVKHRWFVYPIAIAKLIIILWFLRIWILFC
jgi:hypothetical protein